VIVDLTDTNAAKINDALTQARHASGSPTLGMVLTLVVVTDENGHYDALRAATESARQHSSRILTVVQRGARNPARLDAEVRVGGESGPGETILMRLYGELADHAASVVIPLLLPDAPVVAWWPSSAPTAPAEDPLGRLAQRRITDATSDSKPMQALRSRCGSYAPGDTDLAWTRATGWRTILAAALDQPYDPVTRIEVSSERNNPTAELLAAWLGSRLHVPARLRSSGGPGITEVRLAMEGGDIVLSRPDGRLATLSRPGHPDRTVALPRRSLPELLTEELRRLDPDDVYAETLLAVTTDAANGAGTGDGSRGRVRDATSTARDA
jgi:glucose-6-phosphate dehydrogenase assembly protein OpcA